MLDLSGRHLSELIPRAPRVDRLKLEQHLDEIRALERRLAGPEDSLGPDLDHTLVFWVKSIGYNHSWENVPSMLIGGEVDGSYRAGRHLDLGGAPNTALLASVCNIMGLDTAAFGEAPYAAPPADLG